MNAPSSRGLKLTKPQLAELRRLYERPRYVYGKHTVRVQNNLVKKKLAAFCSLDSGDVCMILDAGRILVEADAAIGKKDKT